jgi:enoyl-CoA hydratase/carnithine racemase
VSPDQPIAKSAARLVGSDENAAGRTADGEESAVGYSVVDSVATIVINRPEKLNAINRDVRASLYEAVERVEEDSTVRVAIITGAGERAFCSGADLHEMKEGAPNRMAAPGGFAGFVRHARTKPFIAAVNGIAYGGGFEIVLACDLVVAAEHARFALPEVLRGIVAAGGGAVRLPRVVPGAIARELLLTGAPIAAAAALRWGLVNRVVAADQVLAEAHALATAICAAAPVAVAASLSIARSSEHVLEAAAWDVNDQAVERIRLTRDAREGPRAFAAKRAPVWSGT